MDPQLEFSSSSRKLCLFLVILLKFLENRIEFCLELLQVGSLCHVLKSHCLLGYNVEFEAETVKKHDNFVGVCCASLIMHALAIFILVFVSNS